MGPYATYFINLYNVQFVKNCTYYQSKDISQIYFWVLRRKGLQKLVTVIYSDANYVGYVIQ